jgi:hypothetical protein
MCNLVQNCSPTDAGVAMTVRLSVAVTTVVDLMVVELS